MEFRSEKLDFVRSKFTKGRAYVNAFGQSVQSLLDRVDPNDDPNAEPLSALALGAFLFFVVTSLRLFWQYKFHPMQDLGHHVGLSAVVADYTRPGSLYPELYEKPDPLLANSLLYTVAGNLGKWIGVTRAFHACMAFVFVGIPLANLFALRVFGRSAWPAVLAVPLVYGMNHVAGFSNLVFAGPFLVASVPCFYRAIAKPTPSRVLLSAALFAAVFLAHAHIYLWLGVLTFGILLWVLVEHLAALRFRDAGRTILIALCTGAPSLALFWRWYAFAFGEGARSGGVEVATADYSNNFGMHFHPTEAIFSNFYTYCTKLFLDDADLKWLVLLGILFLVSFLFSRGYKFPGRPLLELCFGLTFFSYYFMPEEIATNPVVGSRQIGVSYWFACVMATPVPARVSKFARVIVVVGICFLTQRFLSLYGARLEAFEAKEIAGLEYVLEPAPFRKRLFFMKIPPDTSPTFQWKPTWHVDKFYMSDKMGQVDDNPAIVSTSSIRYKRSMYPHRFYPSHDWASNEEIWRTHDLVLTRDWAPSQEQLETAKKHGVLLRKEGRWQLWRKKGDWQERGDGEPPKIPEARR